MNAKLMLANAKHSLKKHSPEILIISGVGGMIVSTVFACKATLKVKDVVDEHKSSLEDIHSKDITEEYTEKDKQKETAMVFGHTALELTKLYLPAASIGILSITSIFASNDILRKRNLALAASYAAVDKAFKEYRERVVERFGSDVDHQLRYNIKEGEIEETVTDSKGKEKTVKKKVEVADPNASGYMKYFTRSNPNWEDSDDFVEYWLRMRQSYVNDLLKIKGHLCLNDVYRALDMQETKAGMVVGWIFDLKNPTGDNYIEFDVKKVYLPSENGELEKAYAIDFNVDGNIFEKLS